MRNATASWISKSSVTCVPGDAAVIFDRDQGEEAQQLLGAARGLRGGERGGDELVHARAAMAARAAASAAPSPPAPAAASAANSGASASAAAAATVLGIAGARIGQYGGGLRGDSASGTFKPRS